MASRWLKWGLVASLAVNLFLIAATVTTVLRVARPHDAAPVQRPTFRSAAASLTAADRQAFLALLTREGKLVQVDNQRARHMRNDAWASFASPGFSPEAAKTELANARAISIQSRSRVEAAVVDFAAGLPAAERAALGDALGHIAVRQRGQTAGAARPPMAAHASSP